MSIERGTRQKARIVLADGTTFEGYAFGAHGVTVGEVVFTTGMTGYQEVLTDPSYCGQIVVMTSPHIGNTGVNTEDNESLKPFLAGYVLHEASPCVSNWRADDVLEAYLVKHGVVSITRVDTRALTTHIRDKGAQMAAIGIEPKNILHDRAVSASPMQGQDLTGKVTTSSPYAWSKGSGLWADMSGGAEKRRHIVAIDFGIKHSILKCLADTGSTITVVPSRATAEQIMALRPDGIFLSNGPGDPAAVTQGVETVKEILGKKPVFGICLGHQILGLALGGSSYKLKFGHRGLNQPVKDLVTGRVEITTQNHGFCVDVDSLAKRCEITHIHLNDGTCEGIVHKESGAFSVQYHPEASAGPHDSRYLFQRFVDAIDAER